MRVLAFDSTASSLTVGIADGGKPVGRWDASFERHRGNALDGLIDRALAEVGWRRANVEGLALVTGPGSLTATRIGWATACGWALAGGIPITGWPAAEVHWRRWMQPDENAPAFAQRISPQTIVFCMVHHRGQEFYCYQFDRNHPPDRPKAVILGPWHPPVGCLAALVGPGMLGYRDRWTAAVDSDVAVVPESEALVGGDRLALWGAMELSVGKCLTPDISPLDYGLPPTFKKAS